MRFRDGSPRPRQTEISPARRNLVIVALMLGAFAIGTTEFVSMGLLPLIAGDFGISEDQASAIIAMYALGVVVGVVGVVGAPLITALTGRLPRRRLLIILMAVLVVGLITLAILILLMPHMANMRPTNVRTKLGALKLPQVRLTLVMATAGFAGMFSVYTYIRWTITNLAGLDPGLMWIVLMAYGIGHTLGTYAGGVLADRHVDYTILFFALTGFFGSTLTPNLQVRLMDVAGDAQTLAAALNQSALNTANALGAALGGAVIGAGFSYAAPALAGAALAVVAIGLWFPTVWLRARPRLA